jgi:hypothetical protein
MNPDGTKHTEKDLCKWAAAWLESHGTEVYQEVSLHGGNRADLVATTRCTVTVLEAKLSTSLRLLGQAYYWSRIANMVWVATIERHLNSIKSDRCSIVAFEAFLKSYGIGWVELRGGYNARVNLQAELHRRRMASELRERLRPEMKTLVDAGGNSGGHWTPYRETCAIVRGYVETHPGCSIKQVIGELGKLHYASVAGAKVGLLENLNKGVFYGVRLAADGKTLELNP